MSCIFVAHLCRAELESRNECFDVIIGDLADPIEGGPCYKLYTKSFYECIVKPRLSQGGIFVTQVCVLHVQIQGGEVKGNLMHRELIRLVICVNSCRQDQLEFSATLKCFLAFTTL